MKGIIAVVKAANAARNTVRNGARAAASVVIAAALLFPSFPLSAITEAYADELASPTSPESDIASGFEGHICVDVPLDGSVVDAQGQLVSGFGAGSDAAALDLTSEGDLLSSGLDESQMESQIASMCGNCLDVDGTVSEQVQQQEAELDAQAAEALEQLDVPTYEEVVAEEQAAADQAVADLAPCDPALSPDDVIVDQPATQGASASPFAADGVTYSTAVVLKNIQSVTVYDDYAQARTSAFSLNTLRNYPTRFSVLVRAYGMPQFYAPLVSARHSGGIGYVTIRLPQGTGEEERTLELAFTSGVGSDGYIYHVTALPAVTEATVLAGLAQVPGYDSARERIYLNAYRLAPYASEEDIVASGNRIPEGSALATKTITECWPIHRDDGMKVSLFDDDAPEVTRFLAYYSDGTSETFELNHLATSGLAASYVAQGAGFLYQPDFWVMDGDDCLAAVDRMASFIRSKTWNNYYRAYCASQTSSKSVTFHRTIRDYFDNDIRDNAEEVAANLLTNIAAWCPTASSRKCFTIIMNEAETAKSSEQWDTTTPEVKLFNVLFLYTYWERFLGFDVGGNPEVGAQKNANAFLVMSFRGDVIRSGLSILSMTYSVRAGSMLTYSNVRKLSSLVVANTLGPSTGLYSAASFVQTIVGRLTGYKDMADWFADYMGSIAFYHEYEPPSIPGVSDAGQLTWRGWHQACRNPELVLLWLTLPPGSQYMASTSMLFASGPTGVYSTEVKLDDTWRAYFKGRLDAIFNPASQYAATVASIVGTTRPNALCVVTYDQKASKFDSGTSWMESEMLTGKVLTKDPYHKNFTDPTTLYISSGQGAAAMTINQTDTLKRIHFLVYSSLGCNWAYYWSHEMAHAIDNTIFLNGERRGGNNTEDYTDGLLTQSHGSFGYTMNLCFQYDKTADIMSNFTTDRVEGKDNLNDFYDKFYDTLDVVDYAALQAFLRLDKDEQNAVASQVWYGGQNGTSALDTGTTADTLYSRKYILSNYDGTTATMPVNESVFNDGSKKFETVEEVYDNQIFLRPGISNASGLTWLWANYVSDDLRGVWWYPIHCNGNRPDSRSFKLQMYRMFGDKGFDAFSNFGRSGAGDLGKLQQITGYSSFKEWQMAKWDAIEKRKDSLEYVTFDDLVDKFEAALKTDAGANDRNLTQMHSLRVRMMYLMKRMTDDFRYGIYDNKVPVTYVSNLAGLMAIADDPFGNYVLTADIDIAGLDLAEDATAIVNATFFGKLDGQGHKIYSSEEELVPTLFSGAKTAYIKDLVIEGTIAHMPAGSVVNCELENIEYVLFERHIYTVDDFLKMSSDLRLGLNTFHLMADLDFTDWSAANAAAEGSAKQTAVVTQVMAGTASVPKVLNGNGHTIRGLSGASLFERVAYADIHEMNIVDSHNDKDVNSDQYAALLAKRTYKSSFSDLYFTNVSVSGRLFVGFVCGDDGIADAANKDVRDGGSTFRRIQVYDGTLNAGSSSTTALVAYAGFVAGRACMSTMQDVYVQGSLRAYGTSCGGMVGAVTKSAQYDRCIARVNAWRNKPTYTSGGKTLPTKVGVLIGEIEEAAYDAASTRIANCFGLGDGCPTRNDAAIANPAARLANCSAPEAPSAFENCFENVSARYGATLVGTEGAGVDYVRIAYLVWPSTVANYDGDPACIPLLRNNEAFFAECGFSDDVWQFDPTIQLGNPVLRFDGNPDTYYKHDMTFEVDFQNEQLRFSGSDFNPTKTQIHNLPYRITSGDAVGEWAGLKFGDMPKSISGLPIDENNCFSLTEAIEYEGFVNSEVERKGTRTVTFLQKENLYQTDAFELALELPPRPENGYADNIKGIGAGANGMGFIQVLSVGPGLMPKLEYRAAASDAGGEGEADAAAAAWMPLSSASTAVPAGTYEVRMAATDHSFASYPTRVVIDEFDPDSVTFPLTLDPMGGSWAEGYEVPEKHSSLEATALPAASDIQRAGYTFTGWYDNPQCTGTALTQVAAGNAAAVALYAGWKANTYSVVLDAAGGTIGGSVPSEYTHGTEVVLPIPTYRGHAFLGWFDAGNPEGAAWSSISAESVGDLKLVARWDTLSYEVTLDVAGGALAEDVPSHFEYTYGEGVALPGDDQIAREGYSFAGWYADASYAGSPVSEVAPTDVGDKAFVAKWIPITYGVALVKNGGQLAEGQKDVTSYTYGKGAVLPELVRAGFQFDGWYLDEGFADQPVFAIDGADTGDKTFYAKWTPLVYKVSYDLGSDSTGATPPEGFDLSEFETFTSGETLKLPGADVMVWGGHVFCGWYEDAAFTGSPVTAITGLDEDVTLYARWAMGDACVVFYHTNGGTFSEQPKTMFEVGVDGFERGHAIALPKASTIARPGYEFGGWFLDEACAHPAGDEVELSADATDLYAAWMAVEYRISYELDGGAWVDGYQAPDTFDIESGDVQLPTAHDVEKEGCAFGGWFMSGDLSGDAVSVVSGSAGADVVLYAKWLSDAPKPPEVDLEIVTIGFDTTGSFEAVEVSWNENDYARITLPRNKMPKSAEDFELQVPDGIQYTITKCEAPVPVMLRLALPPIAAEIAWRAVNDEPDIWNIVLSQVAHPEHTRTYTLEITPLDDDNNDDNNGDDGNGDDGNGGNDDDGNNGGNNDDDGNGSGDGDGNGNGSGIGGGPGLVGGSGDGDDAGAGAGGGNGNGGIAGNYVPGGGPIGSALDPTGDNAAKPVLAIAGMGMFALVAAVLSLRRRARR